MTSHASPNGRSIRPFRTTTFALFSAGFSTFALMYCVQPLLPELALAFSVSPATSSLAVSVTTGCLAIALLVTGGLSESVGRKRVMVTSLAVAAALTAISAAASTWVTLLAARAAIGVALAGLPAIAMAYIGEEVDVTTAGLTMGIYVAGTAFGGMAGRLLSAVLADAGSWRIAIGITGGLGLVATLLVWVTLPASTRFRPQPLSISGLIAGYREQLTTRAIPLLLAEGFLFMGTFMALYNYIGFRLLAAPYSLSQSIAGSVFLLYTVGMISSPWAGTLAHRVGRRRALTMNLVLMLTGVLLASATPLLVVGIGMALMTFGFFGAHSVTSAWIGEQARDRRAQASSLYLFCYYLGASTAGAAAGLFWERWAWTGVTVFLLILLAVALALTIPLARSNQPAPGIQETSAPAGA